MQRIGVFFLFDAHGRIDLGAERYLRELRRHVRLLVLVSNGALADADRARIEAGGGAVDVVLERENEGFDVGAYAHALAWLDAHRADDPRIRDADELILANYTCFGPIGSFEDAFARSEALDADIWGMTEHAAIRPDPYTHRGVLPAHLQSHWIAVRRAAFESEAWREYWASMPPIRAYDDSIRHHEARFTPWFRARGMRVEALWPRPPRAGEQAAANPAIERPLELLRAGCPLLKRRVAWMDPLELDLRGADAAAAIDEAIRRTPPAAERALRDELLDGARPGTPRAVVSNLGLRGAVAADEGTGPDRQHGSPGHGDAVPVRRSLADAVEAAEGEPPDPRGWSLILPAPGRAERALEELGLPPGAGAGDLARALRGQIASPWAPHVILLPPDDLGVDVKGGDERRTAIARRARAALALDDAIRIDARDHVGVAGGPALVSGELLGALARAARDAGGSAAARARSGLGARDWDDALGLLLPAIALADGRAVLECATPTAWARRAGRGAIRESALRAGLPPGTRAPFRAAAARAEGLLAPRRLLEPLARALPGPARAARSILAGATARARAISAARRVRSSRRDASHPSEETP